MEQIKKTLTALIISAMFVGFFAPFRTEATIAFVGSIAEQSVTGTSLTYSFTAGSGANRLLAGSVVTLGTSTDVVTGVTYAGVSMTRVGSIDNAGGVNGAQREYMYFLLAPATGANNVVVSRSDSGTIASAVADYTGVLQSGQPDASNTARCNNSTTCTISVTAVAGGSWLMGNGRRNSGGRAAGADTTERSENAWYEATSNPVDAAELDSMVVTGDASDILWVAATFAPSPEVVNPPEIQAIFFY